MICSVCIATCKRPELLAKLLTSIEKQALPPGVMLDVIVVDNDAAGSAAAVVSSLTDSSHITFRYFVERVKNISLARNRAVAAAGGEYLLFIDDDEVADRNWVQTLLRAAEQYKADAVFGPVFPVFDREAPEWIRNHGHMLTGTIPATATGTEATDTWTGNCLVKADVFKGVPGPFNPDYGSTGGEDTDLFNRLRQEGARLIYCNEAHVFEYWPLARTRLAYLLRRGLKGGYTHTRRMIAFARRRRSVRLAMLGKAFIYGGLSLALSIFTLPIAFKRTYWQMKLASNVGRFMAVLGQPYRSYD